MNDRAQQSLAATCWGMHGLSHVRKGTQTSAKEEEGRQDLSCEAQPMSPHSSGLFFC